MRETLSDGDISVRWVRNESMHLTLKFLGEVSEERLGVIGDSLRRIAVPRFGVTIREIGFFPNARSPRVFWAGVGSEALIQLETEVEECMAELGFGPSRRQFSPHLTLARARGCNRIGPKLVESARAFRHQDFGYFETDRFALYRSRLEPSGAVYSRLDEYVLGCDNPTSAGNS